MASFAPIRGTRTEITATPVVDGQFLVETDQSGNNKIYLDVGTGSSGNRRVVGGGSGLLPQLIIKAPSGTTINDIVVTGSGGSTLPVTLVSGTTFECIGDNFGTYNIAIGSNNTDVDIKCNNLYTIELKIVSSNPVWTINGDIFYWHKETIVPSSSQKIFTITDSMFKTTSMLLLMGENLKTGEEGTPVKYKSAKITSNGTLTIEFPNAPTNNIPMSIGVLNI